MPRATRDSASEQILSTKSCVSPQLLPRWSREARQLRAYHSTGTLSHQMIRPCQNRGILVASRVEEKHPSELLCLRNHVNSKELTVSPTGTHQFLMKVFVSPDNLAFPEPPQTRFPGTIHGIHHRTGDRSNQDDPFAASARHKPPRFVDPPSNHVVDDLNSRRTHVSSCSFRFHPLSAVHGRYPFGSSCSSVCPCHDFI